MVNGYGYFSSLYGFRAAGVIYLFLYGAKVQKKEMTTKYSPRFSARKFEVLKCKDVRHCSRHNATLPQCHIKHLPNMRTYTLEYYYIII
jgi:hypothetical protein